MDQLYSRCRICLVDPEEETLIATGVDFCEQIKCFTGIQLSEGLNWPTKICTGCALLIRAARKLRLLCQESEKELKRHEIELKLQEAEKLEVVTIDSDTEMEPEYPECYKISEGSPKSTTDSQCSALHGIGTASPSPEKQQPPQVEQNVVPTVKQLSTSAVPTVKLQSPSAVPSVKQKAQSTAKLTLNPVPTTETGSKSSSKEKQFGCHICPNVYKEKDKLTAHLLVHKDFKTHECEICHKQFYLTSALRLHMNTHTGRRPYKCDFCDCSFAAPTTRIRHQRRHTKEKPYKCKFCGKEFAYLNVLKGHLKTHAHGMPPYKCRHCQRTFTKIGNKNNHEKSHKMKDMDTISVIDVEEEEE